MDGGHGARAPFAYGVNIKQHHSQPQLRDLAARLLGLCYQLPAI
jgi:hypothetical protein